MRQTPIQLKLWTDEAGRVQVNCTHCGHKFDARPQLEQRRAEVLSDPRVQALPMPSKQFLIAALPILMASREPIGPRALAGEVPYSKSAAGHQLQRLADFGIVIPRQHGPSGKRYRYVLAIS
jgi:hypothetical protein